ncbi:MAG: cyclic pyranopterin monophosphate synthase MoaC [Fuerstiella sp.]
MTQFTHFDKTGASQMVDVSEKPTSRRTARAVAVLLMQADTLRSIRQMDHKKGNVLEVARLAGIMATKRTDELIPLCHSLGLESANVDFEFSSETELRIESKVVTTGRTGVEMEALTAVTVAGLTVYDMCKAVDRSMEMTDVKLLEKTGGRSGHFLRESQNES